MLAWLGVLAPPEIGALVLPREYWVFVLEAAAAERVSPYVIAGVMAIESRYDPQASSGRGRCYGLMQLDRGGARSLKVDPADPRANIRGGARILARLLKKHRGNLRRGGRGDHGA